MKKEEIELQFGVPANKKNPAKFYLLSGLFALPLAAVTVFAYLTRGGTITALVASLLISLGFGIMFSFSTIGFLHMRRFMKADPSYKNYNTKKRGDFAEVHFIAICICYTAYIIALFIVDKPIDGLLMFRTPFYMVWLVPLISNFIVLMSDENLYLGNYLTALPISEIRVDNFDELDASMRFYNDSIALEFHCEGKPYKTALTRKTMVELCKVLPGVNRDYSKSPNPRKSPQKFY
jgi:glucan phosphoethanolaminetransferase (alkaline phosphatase superfamily)